MPVLVIGGVEDHMVGVDHHKSFRFPDQQLALVLGRHFSMVEQPAAVGKALAGFSAKLDKQAAR